MGEDNIHAGHRERLKNRFTEHGLENFSDIEALELLLCYAIPRRSTNELAHALLDRFHSFRGVMEAEQSELEKVPGIGTSAALLIRLVSAFGSRYQISANPRHAVISCCEEAGKYLMPYFAYRTEECSVLLCLDAACRVICCHVLSEGVPGSVAMPIRNLVDIVLRDKAARVILAHNHPSGVALPSDADVDTTGNLYRMLRMMDVELTDHLIFAQGDFVSMRESNFFARF